MDGSTGLSILWLAFISQQDPLTCLLYGGCSESKAHASAAAELREMLKESSDPHETAVLQAELELAEKGGHMDCAWVLVR